MPRFTCYRQYDQMDCGPTCLRMVARHYGRSYSMETLRRKSGINREGASLLGISEAAENIGFPTVAGSNIESTCLYCFTPGGEETDIFQSIGGS